MFMRPLFVLLHRWFGLAVAIFLFISGLTGAFISWDHELDALLNPQLFHARSAEKNDGAKKFQISVWISRALECRQFKPLLQTRQIDRRTVHQPRHVRQRMHPARMRPPNLNINPKPLPPASLPPPD